MLSVKRWLKFQHSHFDFILPISFHCLSEFEESEFDLKWIRKTFDGNEFWCDLKTKNNNFYEDIIDKLVPVCATHLPRGPHMKTNWSPRANKIEGEG
jgi:hypothetical protein